MKQGNKLGSVLLGVGLSLPLTQVAFALAEVESRQILVEEHTPRSLESRLNRLESLLANPVNRDSITQMRDFERELQELRGIVEEQSHALELLKKSQQDLFIDLEQRVKKVENPSDTMASKPARVAADDQTLYQAAVEALQTKRYLEAEKKLQSLLHQYPHSDKVADSYFWLGEMYLLRWQKNKTDTAALKQAQLAFGEFPLRFPQHTKYIDALFKLGMIACEQQDWQNAKKWFVEVTQKQPHSPLVPLASTRLKQLQEAGHVAAF